MPAKPASAVGVAGFCQPRRSRARESDDQASLFLRKAYHVVCNCPPHLGGWTASGETFVVKDAKNFSEKVIPTVFKHNNFSSFVRQLNFYGFRKIKSDLSSVDNPWWEFRHPKFVRGMPHLLFEIKRAVHCVVQPENAIAEETSVLKSSVGELKEKLAMVDKSISGLTRLVGDFMRESASAHCYDQTSASLFYQGDPLAAGRKRGSDTISPIDSPPRQYQRIKLPFAEEASQSSSPINCSHDDDDGDDSDSLDELITLCTQDHNDAQYTSEVNTEDSNIDFEDFLTFSAYLEEQPSTTDAILACSSATVSKAGSEQCLDLELRTRARTLSAVTLPVTVHDVPFIMSQLPSVMQARFLEKFAESAGLHFCAMLTDPELSANTAFDNRERGQIISDRERMLSQQRLLYQKINEMEIACKSEKSVENMGEKEVAPLVEST